MYNLKEVYVKKNSIVSVLQLIAERESKKKKEINIYYFSKKNFSSEKIVIVLFFHFRQRDYYTN